MEKKCKIIYLNNFIYILSDDKIKKDDYYILFTDKALTVLRCTGDGDYFNCKKIIATTDTSLKIFAINDATSMTSGLL